MNVLIWDVITGSGEYYEANSGEYYEANNSEYYKANSSREGTVSGRLSLHIPRPHVPAVDHKFVSNAREVGPRTDPSGSTTRAMVAFGASSNVARKGFQKPDLGVLGPSPPGARFQLCVCVCACVAVIRRPNSHDLGLSPHPQDAKFF